MYSFGGAWVAQSLSVYLQLRSWSQGPGIEPCIGLLAQREGKRLTTEPPRHPQKTRLIFTTVPCFFFVFFSLSIPDPSFPSERSRLGRSSQTMPVHIELTLQDWFLDLYFLQLYLLANPHVKITRLSLVLHNTRIDLLVCLISDQRTGTGSPETDPYVSGHLTDDRRGSAEQ